MANMRSISRLHRALQPEREQVKCPNFGQIEIDPTLLELQERYLASTPRRRFALPNGGAVPRFDSPVMSACAPANVPAGRRDFADVAQRERISRYLGARGMSGLQGFFVPPR